MYSSPTIFVAKLLAAMQVLMTLDMPLSTTMALPVTSKPIESTVENLAWQAWIELPPEQKQQVKSRKVTPKSIFTLPLRVECPEGHRHVDSKCIPIAIGSNDVLIDLNALGLVVGNTPADDVYDYDDMGEEMSDPLAFGTEFLAAEAVKSSDGLAIDLKPPANDEPLKFNIFQNKFHIFHEEPLEDYAALSNEGLQSSEKEQNITVTTSSTTDQTANPTALRDLVSEASNLSESVGKFFDQFKNKASASDNANKEIQTSLNFDDDADFNIEAISIPAFANHSAIQLLTTTMDAGTTAALDEHDKQPESDLTTLLQTESFLPLLNHTTATTLQSPEKYSLTALPLREEPSDSYSDLFSLNVEEEVTTLTTPMEPTAMAVKTKQEFTRSVTLNPLLAQDKQEGSIVEASGDNDQLLQESALEIVTNDDFAETTTPMQLDDTTVIESHSSLSTTPATQQQIKEFVLPQEQAVNTFEELQRMRKGQRDQQVVLQKSKVQPVEVLSITTEATATTTFIEATTTATNLPTATKTVDELLLTTTETETETETVTPLPKTHNENEHNDRFYYRFKQKSAAAAAAAAAVENDAEASSLAAVAVTGPPATSATKTIPSTSEIDLAEELHLINELVKGIQKPITLTTTTSTTTTATTPAPISSDYIETSSSSQSLSESTSPAIKKSTLTTAQIWSKILPLLTTTSTTTPMAENSANESFSESQQKESIAGQMFESTTHAAVAGERSNRNSKIIRINGFNKISAAKFKIKDFIATATTTEAATTAMVSEESTPSYLSTTATTSSSSSEENLTYEPYWWLPTAWRLNKHTSTEKQPKEQDTVQSEQLPLLLRFWSAYVPKSS